MSRNPIFKPLVLAALVSVGVYVGVSGERVEAANGRSVIMAARLKYAPPPGWIRHYLGDDRYKVAGNVWKVVSTQLDTYYHRPNCPNMLRQPANIVIGFAGAGEAKEAGYRPDPTCRPDAGQVTYLRSAGSASQITVNRSRRPMRIVLADGTSTVQLPPNWRRVRTGMQTIAGYTTRADRLEPLQGSGSLTFAFVNAPANLNVGQFLAPETFKTGIALLANAKQIPASVATAANNATVRKTSAGGLSGIAVMPGAPVPGLNGRVTLVARGAKIYIVDDASNGTNGTMGIIGSFQPR